MRLRPLRSLTRRAGIAVPAVVAVTLAFTGHQVSAPGGTAAVVASGTVAAEAPEAPEASPVVTVQRSVAGRAPAQRASRSRTLRKAAPRRNWVRPAGGPITSGFGMRWGRMHRGLDFGAAYGSPIYAAATGYVTYAGPEGGYGRLVTIRHAGGITTAYGHMSRFVVRAGQHVTAGQVIAYVGSAGRSTGPHLHFEVRRGGTYLNPYPFLRARGVL